MLGKSGMLRIGRGRRGIGLGIMCLLGAGRGLFEGFCECVELVG